MTLIKNKQIIDDSWHYQTAEQALHSSHNIVDLAYWQANKSDLISEDSALGLLVDGHEGLESFIDDLQYFSLIAVNFPTFADGRGYSLAKTLREQCQYAQELRATGDILPDQALYLARVGFDALELANQKSAQLALSKLDEFSIF